MRRTKKSLAMKRIKIPKIKLKREEEDKLKEIEKTLNKMKEGILNKKKDMMNKGMMEHEYENEDQVYQYDFTRDDYDLQDEDEDGYEMVTEESDTDYAEEYHQKYRDYDYKNFAN